MLDYTKAIFSKTKKDLDTALTVFQFGTQILYIVYLVCILFTSSPIWYLYLSLLIVSVAFFVFDLVTRSGIRSLRELGIPFFGTNEHKQRLYRTKKKRSNIRRIKFCISHTLKLLVLASSLYPIIVAPFDVHPIHIICTTAMILLWIMQIMLEILRMIFAGRLELFYEAMHADIEFVTKPVTSVKNVFKKIVGKEVEEPAAPTKERLFLDELVAQRKEEKKEKKAAEKKAKALLKRKKDKPKVQKEKHLRGHKSDDNKTLEKTPVAALTDGSCATDNE